jgi:predicted Zn-dependent protease
LALSPQQELELGREASEEVLAHAEKYGSPLPSTSRQVERVRHIARQIVRAANIEPLQREVNLHLKGWLFEWDAHVLHNRQANAFCLPAGKIFVFDGLFPVTENDSQLATVMSHEISHALAHHASERLAREQHYQHLFATIGGVLGGMDTDQKRSFLGVLVGLQGKAFDREQESEADHIGLFLMTFAGYEPDQAVHFWERMQQATQGREPPAILSDHPSSAARITAMKKWVPDVIAAKQTYDKGGIAPTSGR